MKLPNGDRAVLQIEKLRDYCLSTEHPRGRHKARVFAASLGLSAEDAEQLRGALLDAARTCDATAAEEDSYGQRYVIEFNMSGPRGRATVWSSWIVRRGEDFPRLVTCYVL